MTERIFNFSAGPAVLPVPVLEQAQREMLSLPGVGMSVMEISHRSQTFDEIHQSAVQGLRDLLGIPPNYRVLFLQGGASLQFSMVPMNLLPQGKSADYVLTGGWSEKALEEAKIVGQTRIAATTGDNGKYTRIPSQGDLKLDPNAAYVHITSNNTLFGTEWFDFPDTGAVPLVAEKPRAESQRAVRAPAPRPAASRLARSASGSRILTASAAISAGTPSRSRSKLIAASP